MKVLVIPPKPNVSAALVRLARNLQKTELSMHFLSGETGLHVQQETL